MIEIYEPTCLFNVKKFNAFCKKYDFQFPQEFVDYLKKYNDAELELNVFEFEDNADCVRYFYGTTDETYNDISEQYEVFKDRMPKKCVPIADTEGGNQVCMSLNKGTYGKIYYWDHETMDTDDDEECVLCFEDMCFLANSFNEFLKNLQPDTTEVVIEEVKSLKDRFLGFFRK